MEIQTIQPQSPNFQKIQNLLFHYILLAHTLPTSPQPLSYLYPNFCLSVCLSFYLSCCIYLVQPLRKSKKSMMKSIPLMEPWEKSSNSPLHLLNFALKVLRWYQIAADGNKSIFLQSVCLSVSLSCWFNLILGEYF